MEVQEAIAIFGVYMYFIKVFIIMVVMRNFWNIYDIYLQHIYGCHAPSIH